jgi:adenylate cyclase
MRGPVLIRLRPTLLTTIVSLVLLTALTIGGAAGLLILSVTRTMINQARVDAVSAARERTEELFGDAPRIVSELAAAAHRGALRVDDRDHLAGLLAEVLRVTPRLAFVGYGNVDGNWYVGAERDDDGTIFEYTADPRVDNAIPFESAVSADGARAPAKPAAAEPYLPDTRPWFKIGVAGPGPVWSPFYKFTSGVAGISTMARFSAAGSDKPTGVFHADLQLTGIAEFLSSLRVGERGAVFLIDSDGNRVVEPAGRDTGKAAKAIERARAKGGAATLDAPARVRVGNRAYEVILAPVPTVGNIALSIAVVVDIRDVTDGAYLHMAMASVIGLVTVVIAMLCARSLSSRIARPIGAIAADLAKVGAFDISRDSAPHSFVREVSELGASVDRMKASLRSFAHYVPTDLVRRLLARGEEAELGGDIRRLTIYFSDIANFTTISEGIDPDRLVDAVGAYLELMTGTITRHGGTVDKFIGDGIMAFFNAPEALPDHPRQACLAALEGQRLLAERAASLPPGQPVFHTRIGLGLGDVLVGNIGTPERFAYTLLGDEVNLASRLEGLNKLYGTAIIASGAVADEAGDGFEWRRLDRVAVKGRHQGTLICELLGAKGEVSAALLAARDVYERGLDAYLAAEFGRAGTLFDEAARLRPGDLAATMMRERALELGDDPPLAWDGVHVMQEK